ncbi:ABC transporter permease [Telmatospirillum siberiense]|uniref:ABC transporter permease n=1 Tax=Telmatospirillum siberiense TaxID=382514 RepID=A0A2N3PNY6_9PROT|nr:ABC transporter permease [Telmatospirillum siberiense]PKU22094.1 ABC transporter permease [Telmatospirillum siberiense]
MKYLAALPAFIYPLVSLSAIVGIWFAAVRLFVIPDYLLPPPWQVFDLLVNGFVDGALWPHIGATLVETLGGYVVGSALGIGLGVLLAESKMFERFLLPLLTGLQAVPKVALGPIILVWCGYGVASKIVLVVLVCFFPLFINTINGLRRADEDLLDACRAFSASRAFLFLHVKLPSAASEIFGGLQIGISLALIGAVVGEFLSSQRGLGYLVSSASVNMSGATMVEGVLLLAVIGMCGAQMVRTLHRHVVFWESRETRTESRRRRGKMMVWEG